MMQRECARGFVEARLRASSRDGETTDLDDVAHADDEEHDPELEPLDDVSTRQLEKVVLFKALEDGALDLDELVGQ